VPCHASTEFILQNKLKTEILFSSAFCLKPMTIKIPANLPIQGAEQPVRSIFSILECVIENADPYRLVDQHILLSNDTLCIGDRKYTGQKTIILVAMGKASLAMTRAAVDKLGERIKRGICVCKALPENPPQWQGIQILQGAHPEPDARSLLAGESIRKTVEGLSASDLVLVLVSGGSSSLVVDPQPDISLDDLTGMNHALLRSGATINEINCVRKHVERLKGGGLARLIQPARIEALLLSDVIGNDMSVIASGPTVADNSTFRDALDITKKYQLTDKLPSSILAYLERGNEGMEEETLKPEQAAEFKLWNTIIGSNQHAIQAAMSAAARSGMVFQCVSENLTGEAESASKWFLQKSLSLAQTNTRPFMAVAGGETTVVVKGNGKGGRNLQVALAAVNELADHENAYLVTLATDGEDGPTDAAGAIVTAETKNRAQTLGLDPVDYLERNDAYTFFEKVGGLIKTGSTGTNVNDLTVFFQF
jgi:hydroxypyruvate reductase